MGGKAMSAPGAKGAGGGSLPQQVTLPSPQAQPARPVVVPKVLPPIVVPKMIANQPAGIVPKVTSLPNPSQSGQVSTPAVLPTAAQVAGLVDAAVAQPTE